MGTFLRDVGYTNKFSHNIETMQASECPICFENKKMLSLHPCKHAFCDTCTQRILKYAPTCPMCRQYIISSDVKHENIRKVFKTKGDRFGIVYKLYNREILILKVKKNTAAHNIGLKAKDVIKSVNGVTCFNAEWIAFVMKESTELQLDIVKHSQYCVCVT